MSDPDRRVLDALRADLLAALEAEADARAVVLDLVRRLDLAHLGAPGSDTGDAIMELVALVLARAACVLGPELAAKVSPRERIDATVVAARAYVDAPSEETHTAFFRAATQSYPFGPGDGCLAARELGGHGTPGAGCASGSGFLAGTAAWIGDAAALACLRRELLPWLRSSTAARGT
jgi:hypothetical protein